MVRVACLAVISIVASACNGNSTAGISCAPGEVVVDDECMAICRSDSDCPGDTPFCENDVCQGQGDRHEPIITSIDGDGAPDGDPAHTAHLIINRLTIKGFNFDGADVSLTSTSGGSAQDLVVCDRSDTELVVEMPSDIVEGLYLLTIVSQGGSCGATLPVLKGTDGIDGKAGLTGAAGSTGAAGQDGADGAPGVPCAGCVDTATIADTAVTAAKIDRASLEAAMIAPSAHAIVHGSSASLACTTTCSFTSAYNIAFGSRTATGRTTLAFGAAMVNSNYVVNCTMILNGSGQITIHSKTTTGFSVRTFGGGGGNQDRIYQCVVYGGVN